MKIVESGIPPKKSGKLDKQERFKRAAHVKKSTLNNSAISNRQRDVSAISPVHSQIIQMQRSITNAQNALKKYEQLAGFLNRGIDAAEVEMELAGGGGFDPVTLKDPSVLKSKIQELHDQIKEQSIALSQFEITEQNLHSLTNKDRAEEMLKKTVIALKANGDIKLKIKAENVLDLLS
jgi:prefoldin subunit 5